jgi:hypothetical protein
MGPCILFLAALVHRTGSQIRRLIRTHQRERHLKLIEHKHNVREVIPIAMFEPDRAEGCSKVRNHTGIIVAQLYRFQGIRNRPLIPQMPLPSLYTGIIPV